jgi:hypothetical protein
MPNKKISELTTVASPLSADYIPVVEDGVTKKATLASLPISDAEVTALALKAPLASPTFTGTVTIPTLALTNDLAVTEGGTGASTAADARTNLGLGTIATQAANNVAITGGAISGITDLAVADGGTGASTAEAARTNLGVAYGPAFSAYQNVATSIPDTTQTKVLLQAETFDTGNCFASSTFTPNVAGYYQFSGSVGFASNPASLQAHLAKNGAVVASGVQTVASGILYIGSVDCLISMNGTTDYVELWASQTSGAPQDTSIGVNITRLSGFLARPV